MLHLGLSLAGGCQISTRLASTCTGETASGAVLATMGGILISGLWCSLLGSANGFVSS